jgi:HK97 family phage prohead protease
MSKREVRTFRNIEVRAADRSGPNGRPVISLRIIRPYVVDDYGSVWLPTTFDAAMSRRLAADPDDTPALCWAHRWEDPIGHGITYTPDEGGPIIEFELDDFEAVPRARQADAQVRSKTVRDCSVGFFGAVRRPPTEDELQRWPGAKEVIESADLDETSLVIRGAVPGAKVLSERSGGAVDVDAVVEIAKRISAGELSDAEGKVALDLLAAGEPPAPPAADPEPPVVVDAAELAALDAALDGALDSIGRSASR